MDKVQQSIDAALAARDREFAASVLAEVEIAPAGGGSGMTLREMARLLTLRRVPDMRAGGAGPTGIQSAIDALSASGGGTLALDGRFFDVDRTIHVKPGVTLDGGWGGFRAAPGFSGTEVVKTDNPSLEYTAAGYAKATNIGNLVLDCGRRRGVRGLHQRRVQKDRVWCRRGECWDWLSASPAR